MRYRSNWEDDDGDAAETQPQEVVAGPVAPPAPTASHPPPTSLNRTVSSMLIRERRRRGWSQSTMASQLGIAMNSVRRLEEGFGINLRTLDHVCEVLGWTVTITKERE